MFCIYRSEGDLYDFESGGEFGLFGEDGVPLQQNSSYSTVNVGEKEGFTGSHSSPDQEKKHKKRPRKTKVWNEMEKDLFLKGLVCFILKIYY